jgi:hypothetical protein
MECNNIDTYQDIVFDTFWIRLDIVYIYNPEALISETFYRRKTSVQMFLKHLCRCFLLFRTNGYIYIYICCPEPCST